MKKKYGYKGFNVDSNGNIYCRNKNYKLGEIAEQTGKLELCGNGLHFCWNLADVMVYYNFSDTNVVIGKIEILGDVINDTDGKKSCTNKLKVVRLYKTKKQLMNVSNIGKDNTGYCNTGDWNTGSRNTGSRNTGDCNTGSRNTGDWNTGSGNTGSGNTGSRNTGSRNTGDWNTGSRNTGDCNTGSRNTGDWNTGYWNSCNYSNGLFNTISPKINLFNKPSDYTMEEFKETKWYDALTNRDFILTKWVNYTEEEMKADESKRNTGGITVEIPYKEACNNWWNSLDTEDKEIIKTMPNFDADIFEEITGVRV